jgi:hypothetical protein
MSGDRYELERVVEDFDFEDAQFQENYPADGDRQYLEEIHISLEARDSDGVTSSLSLFAVFMIWLIWGEDVMLAAIGGFLSTGGPGFFAKFVFNSMATLGESWFFIGASLFLGLIAGGIQIRTSSRDAAFSLLRRDLDEYKNDRINLLSYESHLNKLGFEIAASRNSTQKTGFVAHPMLENVSLILDKKRSFRQEHTQAYSNKCSLHYSILEPLRVLSFTVTMGGLVGFCLALTPNAIIGGFHAIPRWLFYTDIGVGICFALRQGYKEVKRVYYKYHDEKELPNILVLNEIAIGNRLVECNLALKRLNHLIEQKAREKGQFDHLSLKDSTWKVEEECDDVQTWLRKRTEGAEFKSLAFFSSGGASLFPRRRLQLPKLIKSPEEQGESHGNRNTTYNYL